MQRLALGTAQFGLPYGYGNHAEQVDLNTAGVILEHAMKAGLDILDTAVIYGSSEENLGILGVRDWKVISKIPEVPDNVNNVTGWVDNTVKGSLGRLGIGKLHGLLLHRPRQLLGPRGDEIYAALYALKEKGWAEKVGISIYEPDELEILCPCFQFDLVQAPFNVIDQRLSQTGWLPRLKQSDVEVHVRSVFLQGLLLCISSELPNQFAQWRSHWIRWHKWLDDVGLTPLQACLRFVLSHDEIDRVIVGVHSPLHLREIIAAKEGEIPKLIDSIQCEDPDLINPTRWQFI